MDAQERRIVETLDTIVRQPRVVKVLEAAVREAQEELAQNPEAVSASVAVPVDVYGVRLPKSIQSSRVFVLRARAKSKKERHPNSHQRVFSYRGSGEIRTLEAKAWRSYFITDDPGTEIDKRWASVAEHIWHQPVAGDSNWIVIAFHTVPQDELIDEYQEE
jgi:hypothetical protein